jgi:hypothetical protein
MAARDLYHTIVIEALVADGWTVTDDPLYLDYDSHNLYVDLGVERGTIGVERGRDKLAIEIKTLAGVSIVTEVQKAIGQYEMYESVLTDIEPDRIVYLAVPKAEFDAFFLRLIEHRTLRIVVYDVDTKRIAQWINWHSTDKP